MKQHSVRINKYSYIKESCITIDEYVILDIITGKDIYYVSFAEFVLMLSTLMLLITC